MKIYSKAPNSFLGNDLVYWLSPKYAKGLTASQYSHGENLSDVKNLVTNQNVNVINAPYCFYENYNGVPAFKLGDYQEAGALWHTDTIHNMVGGVYKFTIILVVLENSSIGANFDVFGCNDGSNTTNLARPFRININRFATYSIIYVKDSINTFVIPNNSVYLQNGRKIFTLELNYVDNIYSVYDGHKLIGYRTNISVTPNDITVSKINVGAPIGTWNTLIFSYYPEYFGDCIAYKGVDNSKRQQTVNYLNSIYKVF